MTDTQLCAECISFVLFMPLAAFYLHVCFLGVEPMTFPVLQGHVIWIMCCVIMHRTEEAYLKLTFGDILRAGVIMLLINKTPHSRQALCENKQAGGKAS